MSIGGAGPTIKVMLVTWGEYFAVGLIVGGACMYLVLAWRKGLRGEGSSPCSSGGCQSTSSPKLNLPPSLPIVGSELLVDAAKRCRAERTDEADASQPSDDAHEQT